MICLHPQCPLGDETTWDAAIAAAARRPGDAAALRDALRGFPDHPQHYERDLPGATAATLRLLEVAPCLYAQLPYRVSARGVVHLCEITLQERIDSTNVVEAFDVQHPRRGRPYLYPPARPGAGGGDIMEYLCMEVLANHGIPEMPLGRDGWPIWQSPGFVSLNSGKLQTLKMYGDILLPAAPHNLLVSVKSQAARERFLLSGNRLETIGFGFFSEPREFWTTSRINLYKRWGFTAIYLPAATHHQIERYLLDRGEQDYAINLNGRPLYRPLSHFGPDLAAVVGKNTLDL